MYDVRAIRFIKATLQKPINKNKKPPYICLGHFDMISVDQLGKRIVEEPLHAIRKDRSEDKERTYGDIDNCVYSLYMLREADQTAAKTLNRFWKESSVFMTITRIHCESQQNHGANSAALEEFCAKGKKNPALLSFCKTAPKARPIITMEGAIAGEASEKEQVQCVFYDSLELGDTVAVMKSTSLAAILEVVRYLSHSPIVRDTYTYCSILKGCILTPNTAPKPNERAILQTAATRFSIRDAKRARDFFRKLKKHLENDVIWDDNEFYVTGTADHSIQWNACRETVLLRMAQYMVTSGKELHHCFNDVITRVGLTYCPPSGKCVKPKDTSPPLRIDLFPQKWSKSCIPNWAYPMRKLLGVLSAMKQNYVMDDLARLLIPSVNAFLERLAAMGDIGKYPDQIVSEEINSFLHAWAELSNDISQLESQLTQHPELIPVRYYIPALLLQFELKFLEQCALALSDPNERTFHPMLVTTDGFNMYTLCPLDPGVEDYKGPCPLLVFIPIQDLYNPWEIALSTTHEIAHYCEDSSRERDLRHNTLIKCIALYIIDSWYRDLLQDKDDEDRRLRKNGLNYLPSLEEAIHDGANEYLRDNGHIGTSPHLTQSIDALQWAISYYILNQERPLEQYLILSFPEYYYYYRLDYQRALDCTDPEGRRVLHGYNANVRLNTLQHLCSECYADIAMVLLLRPTFGEYYHSAYKAEYERLDREFDMSKPSGVDVVCHTQRMALVISVIKDLFASKQNDQPWDSWRPNQIDLEFRGKSSWIDWSIQLVTMPDQPSTSWNYNVFCSDTSQLRPEMLDIKSFNLLRKYLFKCAEVLQGKLKEDTTERGEALKIVRDRIKDISPSNFNWKNIRDFIS